MSKPQPEEPSSPPIEPFPKPQPEPATENPKGQPKGATLHNPRRDHEPTLEEVSDYQEKAKRGAN